MSERHVTLIGAEQVQSAANRMVDAADRMGRAASSIDDTMIRHQRFLDDWLQRFEAVVAAAAPAVMIEQPMLDWPAEPARPERCPRCNSPSPERHPAMQHEGEVQPCTHPWHGARS